MKLRESTAVPTLLTKEKWARSAYGRHVLRTHRWRTRRSRFISIPSGSLSFGQLKSKARH